MTTVRNLLIVLLSIVILFFVLSDPKYIGPNDNPISIRTDTFYKHDTLRYYKKGDLIPFAVLDTFYLIDSIKIHDTPQMIYDYLSVKAYSDTIKQDSNTFVILDTITHNSIKTRQFIAQISEKMIYITKTIERQPKNELYVGLIGDIRRLDNMIGVGVGLNYKKQKESYILNLTTNQISIGLYKKLF